MFGKKDKKKEENQNEQAATAPENVEAQVENQDEVEEEAPETQVGADKLEEGTSVIRDTQLQVKGIEQRGEVFVLTVEGQIFVQPTAQKAGMYRGMQIGSRFDPLSSEI